jgi:membrane protein
MTSPRKPSLFSLLKQSGLEFMEDNAMKLSASLSYYTIFAIGPLLLLIISLIGLFMDRAAITTNIYSQIQDLVGAQGAEQIINILTNIQKEQVAQKFSIIGLVTLFISATAVFLEIQDSINFIWRIKAKPKKGWLRLITNRLLSFSLIIGFGFLLLVSLLANTLADVLTDRIVRLLGHGEAILIQGVGLLTLFFVITTMFSIIYKVLPDATIHWRDAFVGASFTGIMFLLGKFLIGYYLGNSQLSNTYGAAASIIIVLSWVYYSGVILYFGAEFTKVWALNRGHGIKPYRTAVFVLRRDAKELPYKTEILSASEVAESGAPAPSGVVGTDEALKNEQTGKSE